MYVCTFTTHWTHSLTQSTPTPTHLRTHLLQPVRAPTPEHERLWPLHQTFNTLQKFFPPAAAARGARIWRRGVLTPRALLFPTAFLAVFVGCFCRTVKRPLGARKTLLIKASCKCKKTFFVAARTIEERSDILKLGDLLRASDTNTRTHAKSYPHTHTHAHSLMPCKHRQWERLSVHNTRERLSVLTMQTQNECMKRKCIHAHTCMHTYANIYIHTYIHTHSCMHAHIHTYNIQTRKHTYIHMDDAQQMCVGECCKRACAKMSAYS
jgi:hypothetical protein